MSRVAVDHIDIAVSVCCKVQGITCDRVAGGDEHNPLGALVVTECDASTNDTIREWFVCRDVPRSSREPEPPQRCGSRGQCTGCTVASVSGEEKVSQLSRHPLLEGHT